MASILSRPQCVKYIFSAYDQIAPARFPTCPELDQPVLNIDVLIHLKFSCTGKTHALMWISYFCCTTKISEVIVHYIKNIPISPWSPLRCDKTIDKRSRARNAVTNLLSYNSQVFCMKPRFRWKYTKASTSVDNPDRKVHGANMGHTWVLSAPDGPRVGPMNLVVIREGRV